MKSNRILALLLSIICAAAAAAAAAVCTNSQHQTTTTTQVSAAQITSYTDSGCTQTSGSAPLPSPQATTCYTPTTSNAYSASFQCNAQGTDAAITGYLGSGCSGVRLGSGSAVSSQCTPMTSISSLAPKDAYFIIQCDAASAGGAGQSAQPAVQTTTPGTSTGSSQINGVEITTIGEGFSSSTGIGSPFYLPNGVLVTPTADGFTVTSFASVQFGAAQQTSQPSLVALLAVSLLTLSLAMS